MIELSDHPIAGIFPLLGPAELKGVAESIRECGLLNPIVPYEGKILDGRNRYRACRMAGVEPEFQNYAGNTPVRDVISWNLHRRHLNASQKAAAAIRILPLLEKEAEKRMLAGHNQHTSPPEKFPEGSDSRDLAGALVGVNGHYVSDAKLIAEQAPQIFEEVFAGTKTIADAKRELRRAEYFSKVEKAKHSPRVARWTRHDIVLADPPWRHEFNETPNREIENQYSTATVEEIISHAPKSAADDCILFLWATAPLLPEALEVMKAWDFLYRTNAVWDKQKIGMGYWFRGRHEQLLVGIKGKPGTVPEPARVASVFSEARTQHSCKPACVYEWIERAFPTESKLEMYCRHPRAGWDSHGDEI